MRLLDRLRPQWQHSDPNVRLSAVRQLGEQDQDLLNNLAREDDDARVRRSAIKRVQDPLRLQEIAENESDERLKELAAGRAAEILVQQASSEDDPGSCQAALSRLTDPRRILRVAIGAHDPSVQRTAVARLTEEKALAEVVTKANDPALREEALGRLTDSSILQQIVSNGTETKIALAALEKIDDADVLHAISEERDAHKIVRQRARARLELVITEDHPLRVRARRERQQELCATVEALVETAPAETSDESLKDATERLTKIREEWNELTAKTAPDDELRERFEQAGQAIADKATRLANRKAEEAQRAVARQQILARRLELCERVESLEGETASQDLEQARSDWKGLDPLPPALDTTGQEAEEDTGDVLEKRFDRSVERCEQRNHSWQAKQNFHATLEKLLVEAETAAGSKLTDAQRDWPKLEKRWMKIEATSESPELQELAQAARERFTTAGERLLARQKERTEKQEKVRQDNLARLTGLCGRLEELAQSKELSLKAADRELRLATESLKQLGPLPPGENLKHWKERLSKARHLLFQRFQDQRETEDWKRWANVDVQEKLILRTEALREVSDLATVAKELRVIQEEWKRVGAAPRRKSESLWKRFSKVRDELWGRCEAYFAENLQKKEALCEKVESLADSTEWSRTAETIKRIQAEWKDIGPAPLKQSKSIWRRFRKPCDEFFKKRNEYLDGLKEGRLQNAKKKAELCCQAEALSDSTDWEQTTSELKRLQAEWKASGPAPHKKSEALWNRFRKACDHFYDRRKHRGELELEEKLKQKEAVCVELESIAASAEGSEPPPPEAVSQKVQEAWSQWAGAGTAPTDKGERLQERLQKACTKIVTVFPESLSGTPLDPRANHKRREKLCSRLEELVDLYSEDRRRDAIEDIAEKLKQALAANTIGGGTAPKKKNWKAAREEADRLKANWDRLGPIIDPRDQVVSSRFQNAYANLSRLRRAPEANHNPSKQVSS